MAFKMKYKGLKSVVDQLRKASKIHKKQAEIVNDHIEDMEGPLKKKRKKKSKVKGGGTKKVCLPAAKVRSMSKAKLKSISKLYGGDVTITKARKLKARKGATARDKQLANWFINMQTANAKKKKRS